MTKSKALGGRQPTIIMSCCLIDVQENGERGTQELEVSCWGYSVGEKCRMSHQIFSPEMIYEHTSSATRPNTSKTRKKWRLWLHCRRAAIDPFWLGMVWGALQARRLSIFNWGLFGANYRSTVPDPFLLEPVWGAVKADRARPLLTRVWLVRFSSALRQYLQGANRTATPVLKRL